MYYTTLETYKKKYQNRSLTHAYSAKTKGEHEAWKKSYVTVYGKLLA